MRRLSVVFVFALALVGLAPASYAADPPSITGIAARSGPLGGGDLVTIRGYHLTGTTAVLFGATSSSTDIQVISDTHVQVRTPAHAAGGTYVRIVRPDATSPQSSTAVYDYVPAPHPLKLGPVHSRTSGENGTLSCAAASLCASAGVTRQDGSSSYVFGASVKNGSTWGAAKDFSHSGINGVSCVVSPRRMCMTVGSDGYASRYDGHSWHRTKIAPASYTTSLTSVSCATSSFCQAVSGAGNAYRWNGTSWSGPTRLVDDLLSVSCPQTTFCYAVTRDAVGVRWIGNHWVAAHPIGVELGQFGYAGHISCSSSTFCMAGGRFVGGNRVEFTGVAWSPTNDDHYDFQGASSGVTCTGPLFCVNTNGDFETDYHFATYDGDVTNQDQEFGTLIDCWAAYQCMTLAGHHWRYVTEGS